MFFGKKHIIGRLDEFTSSPDSGFKAVFENIQNGKKSKYKSLFVYVDKILNAEINNDENKLNFIHLHFFAQNESILELLLQFISIKFFFSGLHRNATNTREGTSFLVKQIDKINDICNSTIELSYQSPHINKRGKKKEIDVIRDRRRKLRQIKQFYKDIKAYKDSSDLLFAPLTLINMHKKAKEPLSLEFFDTRKFAVVVENLSVNHEEDIANTSYVALNSDYKRDKLDGLNAGSQFNLIDHIENVVLFNCESRSIHRQFNYADLERLNNYEGTNFKNLIILSFDTHPFKFNRLISQLDRISARYFIRSTGLDFASYVIMPYEINHLVHGSTSSKINVEFIGEQNFLCQIFKESLFEYEDIYELYSIKMRNIYSLCFNDECKKLILEDIFSKIIEPQLISKETKESLLNLDQEIMRDIRITLDRILDVVIETNLLEKIKGYSLDKPCQIILPSYITDDDNFNKTVRNELSKIQNVTFLTWNEIDSVSENKILILDYRDSGKFPYRIYPNIYEKYFDTGTMVKGIFFSMFFQTNYQYTSFDYNRSLFEKIMSHPVRSRFFDWDKLLSKLEGQKPLPKYWEHLWDLENSYESQTEREPIIIKYKSGEEKSYYPTQLFIVKSGSEDHLYTTRAEELFEENSEEGEKIFIQPLEALYKGMNLFKATQEEEIEMKELGRKFGLENQELEHRLWKILLKKKADKEGKEIVYDRLEQKAESIGEKMVGEKYFENAWLNPNSDSLIPRSKKVFKLVCESLELPPIYFRVMLKKRANEKLASRESNAKMNNLIADLIQEGFFDNKPKKEAIDKLNKLGERHDLEEIGITSENIKSELIALVELLSPQLNLVEIQK